MSICGDLADQKARAAHDLGQAQTDKAAAELEVDAAQIAVDALQAALQQANGVLTNKQNALSAANALVMMYEQEINYCTYAMMMNQC